MQHLVSERDRRRFLGRLVREVSRAELMGGEHAASKVREAREAREARRIGDSAPPVAALRAVATRAEAMRPRGDDAGRRATMPR